MKLELFRLNKYFLRYPRHLVGGVLFVVLSVIFQTYPAVFIRHAFDAVEVAIIDGVGEGLTAVLIRYGLLILLFSALRGLFTFLMRQTLIVMSRHIEFDLKNDLYAHYQKLDAGFYKRNNTGDLMNRISEDVSRVRMYLGPAVMYSINTVFATIFTLSFMFSVDVELSLWVLSPMPFLVWAIYRVSDKVNKFSHAVQVQQSAMSTLAQETFAGIRVLKAFAKGKAQTERYAIAADKSMTLSEELIRVNALFQPLMLLLVASSTIIAVWVGGQGVIDGKWNSGVIAEFIYYVNLLTWPIASIGWVMSLTQRAEASMQRISEFLMTEPEVKEDPLAVEPALLSGQKEGAIEFSNVSYTYPDSGIEALKNISLSIPAGHTVVIVGRTGSGKSTLTQLLTRSFDPSSGVVRLENQDLKKYPLKALRRKMAVVPQDQLLFSETIRENISFGSAVEVSLSEIEGAAKKAHVHKDILLFSKKYETVVGEHGLTLSGGQKQRISLARALLKNAPVLVLDDAFSAIDTHTEEQILKNLKTELTGRTALIITQRFSCVHFADVVVLMDNGSILEKGSHIELLAAGKEYAKLYSVQMAQLNRASEEL